MDPEYSAATTIPVTEWTNNKKQAKFYELAEQTGFLKETIEWVHWHVIGLMPELDLVNPIPPERIPPASESSSPPNQAAKQLLAKIFQDLHRRHYPKPVVEQLASMRVVSSYDFGRMVDSLTRAGLLKPAPGLAIEHFDKHFTIKTIEEFLQTIGLPKNAGVSGHLYGPGFLIAIGVTLLILTQSGTLPANSELLGYTIIVIACARVFLWRVG